MGVSTDNPFTEGSGGTEAGSDVGRPPGKPAPSVKPAGTAADSGKQERAQLRAASSQETKRRARKVEKPTTAKTTRFTGWPAWRATPPAGRRKGVQRRDFLKRHRFELAGVGGFYASDALSSTYSYGGALAFYPSEDFGLEVLVTRSPVAFPPGRAVQLFDQRAPLHAQRRLAGDRLAALVAHPRQAQVHRDDHHPRRHLRGRGRRADLPRVGAGADLGGGLRPQALLLAASSRFRLDVRDFLLPQEVLGRGRITNNVTVLGGFSLWLG